VARLYTGVAAAVSITTTLAALGPSDRPVDTSDVANTLANAIMAANGSTVTAMPPQIIFCGLSRGVTLKEHVMARYGLATARRAEPWRATITVAG
jgi:hypothetical protein